MSYLLDKKTKRNKLIKYIISFLVLCVLAYFRSPVFNRLSSFSYFVFRPVLVLGNNIGQIISGTGSYFYFKKSLLLENENLKFKLDEQEARISNYNSILEENYKIKEILGRKHKDSDMILATILSKQNQSIYSTIIIDIGAKDGVVSGQRVFAFGNIPLGHVAEVYSNYSKINLFSNPGEKVEVVIVGNDVLMQLIGRGNGNFEMILPRDFVLEKGTEVVLPGIDSYVIGIVQTIVSDPRDSFQKVLLVSPVNIQELKFVQVEK
ncbi:MAG: hypothetical protein UR25_C0004G0066 [Candidatus Nomurabacteria bacterium GW2011_GWE1_32_28]|uniref:Cell shape-determining protein MreC n=1 Tax=Candidatus Nomurabacteria bacterium GW2011_GWF1_31_48 TaxID=1618767 RepID=A0A0F9YUN4_9BACT|nr:MAG: hypothetical protein UR10_C0004G0066 [Candidatus Nomurabacteria bacterium GW2011_GWF2_30_133]KKP28600.1 MAG: hypothetical protein UR18_C0002G0012 [Candidatus Nomurabacteria bacterium GW2011_GWE2_31_40]KKP30176.1 MAG: hypothetical protein UR19_C0003G0012 [Candidatus Nomurabacteria bacterium GW2011_GWF1_31_48]KKP34702.1 MAG: hypothetical protein UR25_C0004G0066 [Candidatus Nomurabacteria bacterium GW2011_GWE1_32_28]HAS80839.1 hypothetical protein [Candidatus Nomurabacteria bacterium]